MSRASSHVFICHLYVFFDGMSVKVFCFLKKLSYLFSYYWVLRVLYVWDQTSIRCVFGKYFLLVCGSSHNSPDIAFYRAEVVFIFLPSSTDLDFSSVLDWKNKWMNKTSHLTVWNMLQFFQLPFPLCCFSLSSSLSHVLLFYLVDFRAYEICV